MKQTSKRKNENMQDKLLSETDIQYAIDYFGVVELLDNIGLNAISSYLKKHEEEILLSQVSDPSNKQYSR